MRKKTKHIDIDRILGNPTMARCILTDGLGRFLTVGKEYKIIEYIYEKNGNLLIKIKSDTNRTYWFSSYKIFEII